VSFHLVMIVEESRALRFKNFFIFGYYGVFAGDMAV
jgi:hypothetical protein